MTMDLSKWQAASHPQLSSKRPEDLFEAAFAIRYRELYADLWHRIINLHGTVRTLEQLQIFPFHFVYAPGEMEFWRLVASNFSGMAIVALHSLIGDDSSDALTIRHFKNAVMAATWNDADHKALLATTLKQRQFDDRLHDIEATVSSIRHSHVAHRLLDEGTGVPKAVARDLTLDDLRSLFDAAHNLFGAVTFPGAFATLSGDLLPSTICGKPSRSCLEGVLDAIVRDWEPVHEPERSPYWSTMRPHYDVARMELLNGLRTRIGLPAVP
jgi:hypothetical protein